MRQQHPRVPVSAHSLSCQHFLGRVPPEGPGYSPGFSLHAGKSGRLATLQASPCVPPVPRPFHCPLLQRQDGQVAEHIDSPIPTPSRPLSRARKGGWHTEVPPQTPTPPRASPLPRPPPGPFPSNEGREVPAHTHPKSPLPPLSAASPLVPRPPTSPSIFHSLVAQTPSNFLRATPTVRKSQSPRFVQEKYPRRPLLKSLARIQERKY